MVQSDLISQRYPKKHIKKRKEKEKKLKNIFADFILTTSNNTVTKILRNLILFITTRDRSTNTIEEVPLYQKVLAQIEH